jgi:N-acetylneuraminic acid mutarotase
LRFVLIFTEYITKHTLINIADVRRIILTLLLLLIILPAALYAQAPLWTWMGGDSLASRIPVYGNRGEAGERFQPGSRESSATWKDNQGRLWLFGGGVSDLSGSNYKRNDLWSYDIDTRQWAWVAGSKAFDGLANYGTRGVFSFNNTPGASSGGSTWLDTSGHLWMFGGFGQTSFDDGIGTGYLGALWRFNPATGQWAWMHGHKRLNQYGVYGTLGVAADANMPGSRSFAATWTDAEGNLWLLGGYGYSENESLVLLNDMWVYRPARNQWTWMGGSKQGNIAAVYGTMGHAADSIYPGARASCAVSTDAQGNVWLFGGRYRLFYTETASNEIWRLNPATRQWTYVYGHPDSEAVYGVKGQESTDNRPGCREGSAAWHDADGRLWIFGGRGERDVSTFIGSLNDTWYFNPATQAWAWVHGDQEPYKYGVYGTRTIAAADNQPGARADALVWQQADGKLWVYGGHGYAVEALYSHNQQGILSDLWYFESSPALPTGLVTVSNNTSVQLQVAPNPGTGPVVLYANGFNRQSSFQLTLYRPDGSRILQAEGELPDLNASLNTYLQSARPGMYILRLANATQQGVLKLVMQ